MVAINEVITEENPERFLESLQNTHLSLSAVEPANMKYYQAGLRERLLQKREEVRICTTYVRFFWGPRQLLFVVDAVISVFNVQMK